MTPCAPNVVLLDAGHLLYHVVWPVSGTTGDLVASFGTRLAHYPPVSKKIILFDRYDQDAPSAKDHKRTRRGRANEVRLTPNTFIPCREDVILHNSKNKNLLNQTLSSYPLPHNIQLVNMQDCVFDDIDVFVLFVYWTSKMRVVAKIQMEKWNGDVLDINETVQRLGPKKCSQLLGIHALSGCDTVSYPFGRGKKSTLKLLEIDIPGLDQVLGQPGTIHAQLQETAYTFFLPLYGQKGCTTMNDARAHFYRGHKKPLPLKKRPPTDANLQLHVLRAHLQMLLWKAADKRDPPEEARNIANFGLIIEGSAITTAVSTAPVAPQALLDVVSCSCTAECKACCNSAGLSCTD